MSDSIFDRPRRQVEPRVNDERARDFGRMPSRAPDQGGAVERRDLGADALLELAQLIGQTEPFAPPGRANAARNPDGRVIDVPGGSNSPDRGAHGRATFIRPPARDPAQSPDRSYEDRLHENRSLGGRTFEDRSSPDGAARRRRDPSFTEIPDGADDSHFLQPSGRDEYPVAPQQGLAYDGDDNQGDHHEGLVTPQRASDYGEHDEYEYLEGESGQDGDYNYDDEAEHEDPDDSESGFKRRGTTKVVIAVLGLAVFGSAAAFGYRTVFKATPSGPTPIIRADNSPTKVVPAGADTSAKPVNERLGDSSGERLVRRDEDPVDIGASYRSGSGDVGASGPLPDTTGLPPATVPPSGGPTPPSDTKRVRTVTIRADQGAPSASPDRMVSSPDRTVSSPGRTVPPPDRMASRPAPPPPRQIAALPAPTTSAAPTAIAPEAVAPRAAEAGGFVVQLSAQRSEAEAQAAFHTMQAKYSALSGRQPLIRRKDQGERGIFYAAQVGPFGVKSDADQLCETLKSAGGTCFVQKN
jgi:cell division septation protein DedD